MPPHNTARTSQDLLPKPRLAPPVPGSAPPTPGLQKMLWGRAVLHPPAPPPTQQKFLGGHRRPQNQKIVFVEGNIEPTEVPTYSLFWLHMPFLEWVTKRKDREKLYLYIQCLGAEPELDRMGERQKDVPCSLPLLTWPVPSMVRTPETCPSVRDPLWAESHALE